MGVLGVRILDDDIALDVQGFYLDRLREGKSGPAATRALLKHMQEELADEDDAPVTWMALAHTQWTLGRLEDRVKKVALQAIDQGDWKRLWVELPKDLKKREIVVARLRQQLLSKQPAEKKIAIRKPPSPAVQWKLGEYVAYRLAKEKLAILQVWGDRPDQPSFRIVNWQGTSLPTKAAILKLRVLERGQFIAAHSRESEVPLDRIQRLKVFKKVKRDHFSGCGIVLKWTEVTSRIRKVLKDPFKRPTVPWWQVGLPKKVQQAMGNRPPSPKQIALMASVPNPALNQGAGQSKRRRP